MPSLNDPMGLHLLVDGVYEPESVRFLEGSLGPGGCFVDVGANVGFMTLVAARRVGPTGRLLAVEASEKIGGYLQENVSRNGLANAVARRCAAQDVDGGDKEFYEATLHSFGMGSLAPQFSERPTRSPARTLDSLLEECKFPSVDVIKVDVEGYEAAVFRGARGVLGGTERP
jgi:FkbM family methyltransferase